MARPKGTKNIETPEKMMEVFLAYKIHVKSNPIIVKDWVGGMAKEIEREKERPLTLEGFSVYCFEQGITKNVHDYFKNLNEAYNDYSPICSRIKEMIRIDQIEGGMAGIYNPSITQRLNSLTEKVESQVTGSLQITGMEVL
jgi:hypothetical protein